MSLLEVRNATVAYDAVVALHDVSITVDAGEVVSILGANGAGKSTLLKSIVGQVACRAGAVALDGQDITGMKPHNCLERGLTLCPEGRRLFPQMTVHENIRMGAYRAKDKAILAQRMEMLYEMFPKLVERRKQQASSLSGGEQQMVAIARALMSGPRLLMLDEPTLGLAPKMIHEVARLVGLIHQEGIAIILVEQNAKLALKISNRGYVLENGNLSLSGLSADLLVNDHVQRIYLGG